MSKQLLGYICLDKFDDIIEKLKERVYETYYMNKAPYLQLNDKGDMTFFLKDKDAWIRTHEWAMGSYLGLLGMKCSSEFVAETLNVYGRCAEEYINDIIATYWGNRYSKKGVKKLVCHYVEDEFTKPEYQKPAVETVNRSTILDVDELSLILEEPVESYSIVDGEVRYISTTLFKRLPDYKIGNFVEEHLGGDYKFFQGVMKPLMSSFKFISDNQVELDGRTTKLGLGFSNSEFGARRLDIGLYSIAMECENQFISRNERFRETVVHRRKNEDDFKVRVEGAIKNLGTKLGAYGDAIVKARDTPLKHVDDITDIIEHPPNRRFGRIPDVHIDGIIEAFDEDPIYDKDGKITRWSLFNACTRYVRDNPALEDNSVLMNTIDTLI